MALSHIEGIKEYLKQSEINFHRIRIISFCFKHSFGIESKPGLLFALTDLITLSTSSKVISALIYSCLTSPD